MNFQTASDRAAEGYRVPPAPIPRIVDTPPTPGLSVSPDRERLALLARESLPAIAVLAEPELRLAGLRINPRTRGPSREAYFTSLAFRPLAGGEPRPVPLPAGARISTPRWSPDSRRLAFVLVGEEGLELWVADAEKAAARRVLEAGLNAALTVPFAWMPDGEALLVNRVPEDLGPEPGRPPVPAGPIVQENEGRTAPGRTYQDLLQSPHDAALFQHYCTGRLALVPLGDGEPAVIGEAAVIGDFEPAPGGEFIYLETIRRPYSYVVPFYRFPSEILVLDRAGRTVRRVAETPLAEDVPIAFDAVPTGPRSVHWRHDAPATLAWVEALDGGDPRQPAEARDRIYLLEAPFTGEPRPLADLGQRFAGVQWGRGDFAIVYSRWWKTRTERRWAVRPDEPGAEPRLLVERSYQDRYNDPGAPVVARNAAGATVLLFSEDGGWIYLAGEGASPRGDYPFLDRFEIATGRTERLWRAEDPFYEEVVAVLDRGAKHLLTRRESATEPPNYYLRDLENGKTTAITHFPDPAPQLAGIGREIITYERADGVKLSATLLTPPGYDPARDGPLPTLLWAYPREFRDAADAGQIDDSPNRFSRPAGASHLFLLTQGYAILDGPAMPIIGEGEEEPNDRYVEQLVDDARAAVDAVVARGVADRGRIAIGGHSYGAFMTANLLAHSDLFRAGIARSGAYNRTLTPFGFQQEERSYWEAPDVYHRMSPFTHAHRITAPILLIHGEADNNSGTFPMQSERFYHALKGHGATVRYVVLPHESHGYRARESVLHTLAEMVEWLDRWVKNRGA
ncbi:MAG TPA: prolyl oligopeptidase family serine peptidase [Longimicrobiaceae bacterium]|nr:prolyl oligopeptidase family serine peptidase [Longimicrobiaceae bacterium]